MVRQYRKLARVLFALFAAVAGLPTAAFLAYSLVTIPDSRDFGTWFELTLVLAAAAECFRIAWTGDPGVFLSLAQYSTGEDSRDSRHAG
jgi:hypothetical protein